MSHQDLDEGASDHLRIDVDSLSHHRSDCRHLHRDAPRSKPVISGVDAVD
jgi:hypothetical protein